MLDSLDPVQLFCLIVLLCYIPVMIIGLVASGGVQSTFRKFSRVRSGANRTAAEVCRAMLNQSGLQHVTIVRVPGELTDHYDPRSQSIALSDSVHDSYSIAAIGVACHEAGHAVQHERKYLFSSLRTALVPVVNIANKMIFPLLLVGMLLGFLGSALPYPFGMYIIIGAVILFGLSMLFSLVTLPTEFNASARAQDYLRSIGVFSPSEIAASRKVLNAAAMTYIAAFLMSTVQFLLFLARLLLILNRRK